MDALRKQYLKELGAKGGRACPAEKRYFSVNREGARAAARKGVEDRRLKRGAKNVCETR